MRVLAMILALVLSGEAMAETQGFASVNAVRAEAGRSALAWSPRLEAIASAHAADMARRGVMSHRSANGADLGDRARTHRYRFCRIAENVAHGQRSHDAVISAWIRSHGHRVNMLDAGVTEMGLARAPGDYWVLVLARPGC